MFVLNKRKCQNCRCKAKNQFVRHVFGVASYQMQNVPTTNNFCFCLVLSVCSSVIKFNEYITDVGNNISIPCLARGSIMWVKEECNETKEFLVCSSSFTR